jgi:hypothetical protein
MHTFSYHHSLFIEVLFIFLAVLFDSTTVCYVQVKVLENNLWRACNLTAFIHSPVVHLFASRRGGPGFNPEGGTYVKPGFSC